MFLTLSLGSSQILILKVLSLEAGSDSTLKAPLEMEEALELPLGAGMSLKPVEPPWHVN